MKRILLSTFLLLAAGSAWGGAFYEGFAYNPGPLGGNLNTNSTSGDQPWNVSTTGGSDNIVAGGSLGYTGLPMAVGNSVLVTNISGNAKVDRIAIGGLNGGASLYYSCLVQVTDLTGAVINDTGSFLAGFAGDSSTTTGGILQAAGRLVFRRDSADTNKFNFGVRCDVSASTGTSTIGWDSGQRNVGETYLVVVEYEINNASLVDDVSKLWIDPVPGASNSAPDVTSTGGDLVSLPVKNFFLRQNASGPRQVILDEIRIGRTWEYVMGAPEFDSEPVGATNDAGTTATFSAVVASPGSPIAYQWQKNGVPLTDGGNISGSRTATLTVSDVLAVDAGDYTLVVSNALGTPSLAVTSQSATLTVNDPALTSSPLDQTKPPGAAVTFAVTAVGTPALTYQWYKDGNRLSDGGVISGASTDTLLLSGIGPGDVGAYACAVTNGSGNGLVSPAGTLTLQDPAITHQPQSLTVNFGVNAVFIVTAKGTTPLTYQWFKGGVALTDGGNISGANSDTLTVSGASYLDAADYSVIVTNALGATVTSDPATLAVLDPRIAVQPLSATNCLGMPTSFSVTAIGSAPLTYQWLHGGTSLVDGPNISGATTATLTIMEVTAEDGGNYQVVVGGASGANVLSAAASLFVSTPPSIASQPQARTLTAGDRVTFSVAATGTQPLFYQWYKDGTPIGGGIGPWYWLPNATAADQGSYSVVVSNLCGSVTSAPAPLIVSPTPPVLQATNLIVARAGDGSQFLSTRGNPLSFDQFTTDGTYVNTVMIPDSGPTRLICSGSGPAEGYLTRSVDGRLLCFAGYDTNLYSGILLTSASAAAIPRVIGTLNGLSLFNRPVKITAQYGGSDFRCAATDGTNNFWCAGGNSGTYYFPGDGTPVQIQNTKADTRAVEIFNGNLLMSSVSVAGDSRAGIYQFSGEPMTNTPLPSPIIWTNTGNGTGVSDFAVSPSGHTIYFADDRAPNGVSQGGIQRWDFDGAVWSNTYALTNGLGTNGTRHLTVDWSGPNPVLYATTTPAWQNQLVVVTDTGGDAAFRVLATAGPNQVFKGVKFGPISDPPAIATQPLDQTNNTGTTATFTVQATGTAPLTYQWNRGATPLSDGGNIDGASTDTLILTNVSEEDATNGAYTVVVANAIGSVTSAPASLVLLTSPSISSAPQSRTNFAGSTATFVVTAMGTPPLTYAWQKDGSPLADGGNVSGAATRALTLSGVSAADAAEYAVVVSNAAGSLTSAPPATLTVLPPPSIGGVLVQGTDLVLSGSGGIPGATYYLLSADNLLNPINTWTPVATNVFNPDGSFSVSNAVDPAKSAQFFRLEFP